MQQDSSSECSDMPDLASQPNLIHIWTGQREGAGGWGQGEQISAHLLYRILHCLSRHQVSTVKITYMLLDMIWIDYCVFSSPSGDGVISGHADGKIVRYMFQDEHARVSDVITLLQ